MTRSTVTLQCGMALELFISAAPTGDFRTRTLNLEALIRLPLRDACLVYDFPIRTFKVLNVLMPVSSNTFAVWFLAA